jgi:carboxylate-amine ligase
MSPPIRPAFSRGRRPVSRPASPTVGSRALDGSRTLGVEEELFLVDQLTCRPVPAAEAALARWRSALGRDLCTGQLELEFQREQIEVVSPPCTTLSELAEAVTLGRQEADDAARAVGARAVAMATSVDIVHPHVVSSPRYLDMMSSFGATAREQLTCGFHVHVRIADDEEGVAVLDRIRVWLPLLLALSSNSPFWKGQDSGYASYRYQMWSRWPSAGPCEPFGSAHEYHRRVGELLATGVPLDEGMIYFDARLSRSFPTVEVRIADVCMDAEHAAVLAGVIRSLVETAATQWREGRAPAPVLASHLVMAGWRASKSGLAGELLHPVLQTPCPSAVAVAALLEQIRPALRRYGDESRVERGLGAMLRDGTGATRQRLVMLRTGDRRAVVLDALERTHQGSKAKAGAVNGR